MDCLESKIFLGESKTWLFYKCGSASNTDVCFIKTLKFIDAESIENLRREVLAVSSIGAHPNICQLKYSLASESTETKSFVVYEHLSEGNLSTLLASHVEFNEMNVIRSICSAVEFMHSKGFMHRDLKASNIMFDSEMRVKLIGFGLCCSFLPPGNASLTPETGSYRWMAPEVIRHEMYNNSADMYSFGILMYEIFARAKPYGDISAIEAAYQVAKKNLRPCIPADLNSRKKALMTRCWHADPPSRPSFQDLISLIPSLVN